MKRHILFNYIYFKCTYKCCAIYIISTGMHFWKWILKSMNFYEDSIKYKKKVYAVGFVWKVCGVVCLLRESHHFPVGLEKFKLLVKKNAVQWHLEHEVMRWILQHVNHPPNLLNVISSIAADHYRSRALISVEGAGWRNFVLCHFGLAERL